jgi:hypothetical protein
VVLTMIRFLAYTLSLVFYHRQVCSRARRKCDTFHELAKPFASWFSGSFPKYQLISRARLSRLPATFSGVSWTPWSGYSFPPENSTALSSFQRF